MAAKGVDQVSWEPLLAAKGVDQVSWEPLLAAKGVDQVSWEPLLAAIGFKVSAKIPAAPPDSPFQGTFKHILWHLDEHILVFIHP